MDFTLKRYRALLRALKGRDVILRHDVDKRPGNSLRIARMEAEEGWKAVYYFRAVPCSWDEKVIQEIAALGHEVGYHYECLTTCHGDLEAAWADFQKNLVALRKLAPVRSICMHGSPRSPWDSRDLWKHYDYKALGIETEPYLDTDFSTTFYLTDTGRRWDGWKASVRDKIPHWQEVWEKQGLVYHTTRDILRAAGEGSLPQQLMLTTHPQRWEPFGLRWMEEFLLQRAKNLVKRWFFA